jgi:hypothetical protein
MYNLIIKSHSGIIGIATRLQRLDVLGFESWERQDIFLFSKISRQVLEFAGVLSWR